MKPGRVAIRKPSNQRCERSMLDAALHPRQPRRRQSQLPTIATSRPTSIASSQLDDERKRLVQETQVLQQRQNEVAKLIAQEKDPAKKQELIAEGKTAARAGREARNQAKPSRRRPACGADARSPT